MSRDSEEARIERLVKTLFRLNRAERCQIRRRDWDALERIHRQREEILTALNSSATSEDIAEGIMEAFSEDLQSAREDLELSQFLLSEERQSLEAARRAEGRSRLKVRSMREARAGIRRTGSTFTRYG